LLATLETVRARTIEYNTRGGLTAERSGAPVLGLSTLTDPVLDYRVCGAMPLVDGYDYRSTRRV